MRGEGGEEREEREDRRGQESGARGTLRRAGTGWHGGNANLGAGNGELPAARRAGSRRGGGAQRDRGPGAGGARSGGAREREPGAPSPALLGSALPGCGKIKPAPEGRARVRERRGGSRRAGAGPRAGSARVGARGRRSTREPAMPGEAMPGEGPSPPRATGGPSRTAEDVEGPRDVGVH